MGKKLFQANTRESFVYLKSIMAGRDGNTRGFEIHAINYHQGLGKQTRRVYGL